MQPICAKEVFRIPKVTPWDFYNLAAAHPFWKIIPGKVIRFQISHNYSQTCMSSHYKISPSYTNVAFCWWYIRISIYLYSWHSTFNCVSTTPSQCQVNVVTVWWAFITCYKHKCRFLSISSCWLSISSCWLSISSCCGYRLRCWNSNGCRIFCCQVVTGKWLIFRSVTIGIPRVQNRFCRSSCIHEAVIYSVWGGSLVTLYLRCPSVLFPLQQNNWRILL